jgi:DNA-binding response OmpR family regulator
MHEEQRIRAFVVGDDPSSLTDLEHFLGSEGFETVAATYRGESFVVDSSLEPDVILLDLKFHRLHEFVVCERIRATDPGVVIVVLSTRAAPEDVVRGLDSGADDYVTRPFSPELLLARIRALVRGRRTANGEQRIVEIGDLWIDVRNYVVRVKGRWVDLSPQEFRLLATMARSLGETLSRRELIRRIGARWRGKPSRTVDVNISRIRSSVELPSDYTYIHTVRGRGYRFEPVPKEAPDRSSPEQRTA